jgi:predicted Zn finger-like uncharacterized protein
MKFLCPSCKAKYQIADDKVSGRSVRMKCRKCGFIIPISEVPPAPPSMTPDGDAPPPNVPKAPPAPNVTTTGGRTPPSPATREGKPGAPAPGSILATSKGIGGPTPPGARPAAPGVSRAPAPGSVSKSPAPAQTTPKPAEAKSSPVATEQKSSPVAAERKSAPGAPPPPVQPKAGVPARRPAPSDAKAAPPPKPGAARPSAAGAPPRSSPTGAAPPAAPAPPPSSPAASAPVAAASSPAAATEKKPASSAVDDLLPAVDDEEGDGVTRIAPGGALADAFGALVSGAHQAPPAEMMPHTADEWYVGINEVPVGPIRLNELRKRALIGAVTMESLVWRDGLDAWRPLKTFPELVAVLEEGMSSVFGSRAPIAAAAKPASESDPFGSGVSPGAVTGPVVVTDDLAAAGIPRGRTPIGAWIAVAIALAFGVVIGFVAFSKQKPPETIVKYVEVQPDGGVQPGAAAADQATPEAMPGAASAQALKPRSGSNKNKATGTPEKEGSGLPGLKGLSGLNPGGPATPGGTSPGAAPPSGGGQLESTQIQATVAKYTGSVKRSCWQPALDSRDPSAPTSARVMVTIVVGPSGSVQNVSTSGEPRGYPGLASCIAGRVRSWQFPATGGTTTANVPFVFAAQ